MGSETNIADIFRRWGYLQASIDHFDRLPEFPHRELDAATGPDADHWRSIYCGSIAAEFMHIPYPERIDWIAERMESEPPELDQQYILKRLLSSEHLERFIHTRYVGAKRFSLEGLCSLIPLLDSIVGRAADIGFEIAVAGMSHRGRLNVMMHIAQQSPETIFTDFEDVDPKSTLGSGDVKYHKGATGLFTSQTGNSISVRLASNPSHLEAINPIVMGRARARQTRINDKDKSKVLALLIHGDAAFAGQGITAEALNFASLYGFNIGGTVHVIANNMIGFTAEPHQVNSSRFVTDVAKRLPIPIFHVNAQDPDAVARVGLMAMDYRKEFRSDVVIDLIGHRKYGHSEIDDPTITSPQLYKRIKEHPAVYETYAKTLGLTDEQLKQLEEECVQQFSVELETARSATKQSIHIKFPDYWGPYVGGAYQESLEVETKVPADKLARLTEVITTAPEGFTIHPKVSKGLDQRREMGHGKRAIDWGMAEALAFGSLLEEGTPVRLSGQDSRRGTFNHRQSVLFDYEKSQAYIPLRNISAEQGHFDVHDSMLSEAAALGFEYGFSRDYPEALVCWEAQFGDFANGAQIIFDQFISAGEDKWGLLSGLVMLLPHGFEGQGPEHSSARVERFLQLAAEDNMQVCQPSTAGQYFHLLRRQARRKWRKPLVVFTPKSMLRAASACSPLEKLTDGRFENVIDDPEHRNARKVILCSGKAAHDLMAERRKRNAEDTAIVRIEQLYPFPQKELKPILSSFTEAVSFQWVQEEPANMGPLFFVRPRLRSIVPTGKIGTVRRSESASPATGSPKAHAIEQQTILNLAFADFD